MGTFIRRFFKNQCFSWGLRSFLRACRRSANSLELVQLIFLGPETEGKVCPRGSLDTASELRVARSSNALRRRAPARQTSTHSYTQTFLLLEEEREHRHADCRRGCIRGVYCQIHRCPKQQSQPREEHGIIRHRCVVQAVAVYLLAQFAEILLQCRLRVLENACGVCECL